MLTLVFTPSFLRQYKKLELDLREEVREKIAQFQKNPRSVSLKAHKLKGKLKGYWSFSVNFQYRIVYEYDNSDTVALLKVGNHSVYK